MEEDVLNKKASHTTFRQQSTTMQNDKYQGWRAAHEALLGLDFPTIFLIVFDRVSLTLLGGADVHFLHFPARC